jgi:hypothetical protein
VIARPALNILFFNLSGALLSFNFIYYANVFHIPA